MSYENMRAFFRTIFALSYLYVFCSLVYLCAIINLNNFAYEKIYFGSNN
jgi:hypothetical protein